MAYQFKIRRIVEFSDTDMAGIVHHAVYYRYMEAAEHAFFRSLGLTVAPPKTPMAIVNKVNADINEALRQPEVLARLAKLSAEVVGGNPQETAAYFKAEVARWQKVIKSANVKLP